jgi:hypothetical protein
VGRAAGAPEDLGEAGRRISWQTGIVQAQASDHPDVARFGGVEISEVQLRMLSSSALVDRLVDSGISRLSADRMVAIERGGAEAGRARRHTQAHR